MTNGLPEHKTINVTIEGGVWNARNIHFGVGDISPALDEKGKSKVNDELLFNFES